MNKDDIIKLPYRCEWCNRKFSSDKDYIFDVFFCPYCGSGNIKALFNNILVEKEKIRKKNAKDYDKVIRGTD